MIVLIYKEFKQWYIDVIKLTQYLLLFFYFARDVPYNIKYFWWFQYTFEMNIIDDIFRTNFFVYWFNQLSYYMLIVHIIKIKKTTQKIGFEQIRKEIKKSEIKSLILSILFWLIVITQKPKLNWRFEKVPVCLI